MAFFTWAGGTAPLIRMGYEPSVGITAGTAYFITTPTDGPPGRAGDFVYGDEVNPPITLRDCYIDQGTPRAMQTVDGGTIWVFRVLDRRWRWRAGFAVDGQFNTTDRHKKFIPWRVRSPYQLAVYLLERMGERGYSVSGLPGGLAAAPVYTVAGTYSDFAVYKVKVNGVEFSAVAGGFTGIAAVLSNLADQINGSTAAAVQGKAVASWQGEELNVTTVFPRRTLALTASADNLPDGLTWAARLTVPPAGPNDFLIDPTTDFLGCGTNYPQSGFNQEVSWNAIPAAQALDDVCSRYGCLVVFDHVTDTVSVQRQGVGSGLPDGAMTSTSPSVDYKAVPSAEVVVGDPTVFQIRLAVGPVGDEYDGSPQPLSRLSYAPQRQEQRMEVRVGGDHDAGASYFLHINGRAFSVDGADHIDMYGVIGALATAINGSTAPEVQGLVTAAGGGSGYGTYLSVTATEPGYEFTLYAAGVDKPGRWEARCEHGPVPVVPVPTTITATFSGTFDAGATYGVTLWGNTFSVSGAGKTGMSQVAAAIVAAVAGGTDPRIVDLVTPTVGSPNLDAVALRFAEPFDGTLFEVSPGGSNMRGTAGTWTVAVTNGPLTTTGGKGFEKCPPPTFPTVNPTERLAYRQAVDLANACVYRNYRVLGVSPFDGTPGIPVPGLPGRVNDPYRLVLRDSRPEQMAPSGGDVATIEAVSKQPYMFQNYNGYSKNRAATSFGSVLLTILTPGMIASPKEKYFSNSQPESEFYIPFSVSDPEKNIITYAEAVYRNMGDTFLPPKRHVIETGVLVLDPVTNAPLRYSYTLPIPGGLGPPEVVHYPDVRQEIIGKYDIDHQLTGFTVLDGDAESRARGYAVARAATYAISDARTNEYPGILPISLSGLVRQVSYEMSTDGFRTTASANCEHSTVIPGQAERRFREGLSATVAQRMQNLASKLPKEKRGPG